MDRIFARSITFFREEKGMTQSLAAKLAGITQSQLSRLEDGENWPNKATLGKICKGWKISGKEFFGNMGHHLIYIAQRGEIWIPYEEENE